MRNKTEGRGGADNAPASNMENTMVQEDIETMDDTIEIDAAGAAVPAVTPAQPLVNPFALFAQRNRGGGFFKGDLIKLDHSSGNFLRVRGENKTVLKDD